MALVLPCLMYLLGTLFLQCSCTHSLHIWYTWQTTQNYFQVQKKTLISTYWSCRDGICHSLTVYLNSYSVCFTVAGSSQIFLKMTAENVSVENDLPSTNVPDWKRLLPLAVSWRHLLMNTLHERWNFSFPPFSLSASEETECVSLCKRAANSKVGAVGPVLAFDPDSALFKRPSLTERGTVRLTELCVTSNKLKDAQRAFVMLSWRAKRRRLVLQPPCVWVWVCACVCWRGVDLTVCAYECLCICVDSCGCVC